MQVTPGANHSVVAENLAYPRIVRLVPHYGVAVFMMSCLQQP